MSLQETDKAAAAKATKPRVALADIEAKIVERYDVTGTSAAGLQSVLVNHPLVVLSLCILVMRNGYVVVGVSAPASPENYDAELGKKFAYENAIRQLWPLEGYALREKLARGDTDLEEFLEK